MCGFAGRFHPDGLPPDAAWHERADRLLAHRGPDGRGHLIDERCELVHRRLALIDLSPTGHQPMPNEDGTVQVVFNGEIYNHTVLREDLRSRGHVFRGTSDTEVLVHLYEEHGAEMAARLRGMFAFAVYDSRNRRLLLCRDRFGIKPLFLAALDDQLVFASEMKAILALSGFRPSVDHQACYDFLGLGYVPEPLTGFTGIRCFPRATTLTVDSGGRRMRTFFRLAAAPDETRTLEDAAESVSSALTAAVTRQQVADVPVAALLSGGIDSSLVVAAYCRTAPEPPMTFNVRFPDTAHDETALARSVSGHFGTKHQTIDLSDHELTTDSVLRLLTHFDQPFADTSLIPMYWISRAVRDHGIICTLSGDGGDEAFGGYSVFWRAERLLQLMRLPRWLQGLTRFTGESLAGWTTDWGRQLAKAARIAREGREDLSRLLAGLASYLSEDQKEELVLPAARDGLRDLRRHFENGSSTGSRLDEISRRMTESLFAVGLPGDMLRKVDMMSMLARIEVRVPMLDEEVVDAGLSLPHRLKTDGSRGKLALRELARRWLPDPVVAHPKHGFTIPFDRLAPTGFPQMLRDTLLSPDARTHGVLDGKRVRHWLELFENAAGREGGGGAISREGLYQRVMMLLSLELWMREHGLDW